MRYLLRQCADYVFTASCFLAVILVVAVIGSLLWTLVANGWQALDLSLFTQMTAAPGAGGGLLNAIMGSLLMVVMAVLIATPIGLLIAVFLSEFNSHRRVNKAIRFINDVLLSAPSIIIGLFCYALFVRPLNHFSAFAGAIALAIIALPIIVRTSEDMLAMVPAMLREAACALGAPYWRVILQIVCRAALSGLLTGVLLAIARIVGETAPLLFTSLNNQYWSLSLNKPTASLPIVIYQYAMSPYRSWQHIAWAGALLITLSVAFLTIVSYVLNRYRGV